MLKIIDDLRPFFEDCYRRISVREYARLKKISPPTASTLLSGYHTAGLLSREADRRYLFFSASKGSSDFRDLSRIYWRSLLSPLVRHLEEELALPAVILFGSLANAEVRPDSDIDLAILAPKSKKQLDVARFERALKRNIHIVWLPAQAKPAGDTLRQSVVNGYVLSGRMVL